MEKLTLRDIGFWLAQQAANQPVEDVADNTKEEQEQLCALGTIWYVT